MSAHRFTLFVLSTLIGTALAVSPARAVTDPNVLCHKTVVKQLEKYKKTHLKIYQKCLDKENAGDITGPCLDSVSAAKLTLASGKVNIEIAKKCTFANLTTVGFRNDCQYGAATPGVGGTCAALPVTTASEFAECMKCWKGAEFARLEAQLYASHAQEVCGTALDDTSTTCAAVGCTAPLPNQHDLGGSGENDCQKMLSKATMNYLLKREHILEKCLLNPLLGTLGACLGDGKVQLQLAKAELQKDTLIHKKCGNRKPVADPPFCCNTGPAQVCVAAATRDDCVNMFGGSVKEGKVCNAGTCDPTPGNQSITWWESCPNNSPCPGPTLGDLDGVVNCVDSLADGAVANLLCLQFPNGNTCPTPAATPTPTVTPTP